MPSVIGTALLGATIALSAVAPAEAGSGAASLFWFDGDRPRDAVGGCIEVLSGVAAIGLDPRDYGAADLASSYEAQRAAGRSSPAEAAGFDARLTSAFGRLLEDAHRGRIDPRSVGFDIDVGEKRLDLPATLRAARDGGGCAAALDGVQPRHAAYRRLVQALERYRSLAAKGEPPLVPPLGPKVRKVEPGTPWSGVDALDARLRALGDLPADAPAPRRAADGTPLHAGPVVDGLKRFQGRHALDPDGVIGPATIAALDTPVSARVRQIELALERMRWLPEMPDEQFLFVNIPLFMLWAVDPADPAGALRMRVVTGRSAGHETPVFMDRMEYLVFRPYWYPPPSIVREEILPRVRRDAGYLDRQAMEIVPRSDDDAEPLPASDENLAKVASGKLVLRQRPGERNALGLAKFIFPNANNVYMHGTPVRAPFSRARRDYSHGCIRLEDPARLAEWLLRDDPEWSRARIDEAMAGERTQRVRLRRRQPVVIFYDTVLVYEDGVTHFAADYYRHDARLEEALRRRAPEPG
ncbi:MAG TPA: L,D-transpeptidase family protein [Anaeromyxobacteraceae bacterium]|nr:L,D-transpeptidase family protein [Anaeromyxobacteraceae bacterium]